MNFLKRINFLGWFLIILVLCYAVWNPWRFSVYDMVFGNAGEMKSSAKLIISLIVGGILIYVARLTWERLGALGIGFFIILVGAVLFFLYQYGFLAVALGTVEYWGQIIVALLLTVGFQWAKFERATTGVQGTTDPDTVHTEDIDHHHQ